MKRSRLKSFSHRKKTTQKDSEGNTYPVYGIATAFIGEAWPASGKIQAQIYGDRLPYIYNMRIHGKYEIIHDAQGPRGITGSAGPIGITGAQGPRGATGRQGYHDGQIHYFFPELGMDIVEGDGICLFVSGDHDPDFRIISVKPHRFLRLEVEKL